MDESGICVATFEPWHADWVMNSEGRVRKKKLVRAFVAFHLSELTDEKAIPELLLSLVVGQQLRRKLGRELGDEGKMMGEKKVSASGAGWAAVIGVLLCVVQ